ncbi:MAG: ComEC/Rec2 family competence protein, partial [candidate division Zixibacteria bacterium]|nr:ComEC/Rec2 family competence protein [candidate division Zixibacteria bacterium]
SVIRASVVAALVLTARVVYRRADLNNILALAAASLILYDPGNLFDVGFQLSFVTAWGLVLFLPPINALFVSFRWPAWMRYLMLLLSTSLIASLLSSPITLAYFGEASAVTVFSNMIVVPLVSMGVIGIMILLIVQLALPAAAVVPGMLLDRLLRFTGDVVSWFSGLDWAEISAPSIPAVYVLAMLAIVCCLFAAIRHRAARRILVFMILGGAVVHVAVAAVRPDRLPDLEVFNQGSSQTIVVNHGPGVAIYRQAGSGRYDDFTGGVLSYLTGREKVPPQYYIFFEPQYQTEARLVRWADAGVGFPMTRIAASGPISQPALYLRTPTGNLSDTVDDDTSGCLRIGSDAAVVVTGDSCQLVFAETTGSARRAAGPETGLKRYYFIFADTDAKLAEAAAKFNHRRTTIILTKQSELYKLLSDKELNDFWPDFRGRLVEKGTGISLNQGDWDRPSD